MVRLIRLLLLGLYYCGVRWLPPSALPGGSVWRKLRFLICSPLFAYCGKNVNIERRAFFGSGKSLSIGNNSAIGINATILGPVTIGRNVMMGEDVIVITRNHQFSWTDIPMIEQGYQEWQPVTIGDNVWIGARVIILGGVSIGSGVIIGAGAVVSKDIPNYAVVVGNPARIVRYRNNLDEIDLKNAIS